MYLVKINGRLLLQALAIALVAVFAMPRNAAANELASVFDRLLLNPGDLALNIRYAELVEANGDLRKALGAYERAIAQHPNDPTLRRSYRRVKRKLQPSITQWTIESGVSWESNPLQLPDSDSRQESDLTYDTRLLLFDERTLARHRWRSLGEAWTQIQGDVSDLSAAVFSFVTGPIFEVGEKSRLHIAPGAAAAWLDGDWFYNDALLKVTFETVAMGATQTVTATVTHRDTSSDFRGSDGVIVELAGKFAKYNKLKLGDAFYILPRFRYSQPTGSGPGRIFSNALLPGDFTEVGSRAVYFVPVAGNRVYVGAGFGVYRRTYNQNVAFGFKDRKDWLLEPTAHLVISQVKGTKFDLRFDYRYEDNDSNDPFEDFDNHVVGARAVRRF